MFASLACRIYLWLAFGAFCTRAGLVVAGVGQLGWLDVFEVPDEVADGGVDLGLVFLIAVDSQFVVVAVVSGDPDGIVGFGFMFADSRFVENAVDVARRHLGLSEEDGAGQAFHLGLGSGKQRGVGVFGLDANKLADERDIHFRIFSAEKQAGARARLGVRLRPGAAGKVHCEVQIAEAFGSHARASLG